MWLACTRVTQRDGRLRGRVVNGEWNFAYDLEKSEMEVFMLGKNSYVKTNLLWACNPIDGNYTEVIIDAEDRYNAGEEANWGLIEEDDYDPRYDLNDKFDKVTF